MRAWAFGLAVGMLACGGSSGDGGTARTDSGTGGSATGGGGGTGGTGAIGGSAGDGGGGSPSGSFGPAEVLASNQTAPFRVVLRGGTIYWTSRGAPFTTLPGSLQAVPEAGDSAATIASGNIVAVTTTSDALFWVDETSSAIYAAGLDGSNQHPLLTPIDTIADIAAAGTDLYFTLAGGSGSPLQRVPIAGGPPMTLAQTSADTNPFFYLVADESDVYASSSSAGGDALFTLSLSSAIGGLFAPLDGLGYLALDSSYVYVATEAGAARYARTPNSTPQPLGSVAGGAGIAVDADAAYVTTHEGCEDANGVVYRIPFDTMLATPLATNQACPNGIAVDASGVYWVNAGTYDSVYLEGSGQLMRAPRL